MEKEKNEIKLSAKERSKKDFFYVLNSIQELLKNNDEIIFIETSDIDSYTFDLFQIRKHIYRDIENTKKYEK